MSKIVSSIFLVLVATDAQANLILNGDFSLGNVGFSSGYTYTTSFLDVGRYAIGQRAIDFHGLGSIYGDRTTGDGNMMIVNGASIPNVVVWEQTIAISPNTNYVFTGWGTSWSLGVDPSPASLRIFINDAWIGADFSPPSVNGLWSNFDVVWNSQDNTSAKLQIVNMNIEFGGNDFSLDDLSFRVVPEPSGLALCLVGLFACVNTRRKRP